MFARVTVCLKPSIRYRHICWPLTPQCRCPSVVSLSVCLSVCLRVSVYDSVTLRLPTPRHNTGQRYPLVTRPGPAVVHIGTTHLTGWPFDYIHSAFTEIITTNAPITTATKLATLQHNGLAHAHSQWRMSQWRDLSDGRRMEQPRTGALVNIHRLKSCRVIGCNLQQNA